MNDTKKSLTGSRVPSKRNVGLRRIPGPVRKYVFSEENSTSTARLSNLVRDEWWTDNCAMPEYIYIHVPHRPCLGMDGTVHRVYPKNLRGRVCCRVAMFNGKLYWLHDKKPNNSVRREPAASGGE